MSEPYNPLARLNLAKSIEAEIAQCPLVPLAGLPRIVGAGVYAIFYAGDLDIYQPIADSLTAESPRPIYVGKAIPKGGRIGGLDDAQSASNALKSRLQKHAASIRAADNLSVDDFHVRYLSVDDIWIPLGENILIETHRPVWNRVIWGFGNNALGKGRPNQKVSLWDILHPGRETNVDPERRPTTQAELAERVRRYFSGKAVPEVDEHDPGNNDEDPDA